MKVRDGGGYEEEQEVRTRSLSVRCMFLRVCPPNGPIRTAQSHAEVRPAQFNVVYSQVNMYRIATLVTTLGPQLLRQLQHRTQAQASIYLSASHSR